MRNSATIKNQLSRKAMQKHTDSILAEVRNKSIIEEMEIYKVKNDIRAYKRNHNAIPNPTFIVRRIHRLSKAHDCKSTKLSRVSDLNVAQTERNNRDQSDFSNGPDVSFLHPCENVQYKATSKKRKKMAKDRLSSRIELKLQQIMEYTNLFPTARNSHESLGKKINRIGSWTRNSRGISPFSTACASPNSQLIQNLPQTSPVVSQKQEYQTNKPVENKSQLQLLELVEPSINTCQLQEDQLKLKQINELVQKSRNNSQDTTPQAFDFSLTGFLQQQITKLKLKTGQTPSKSQRPQEVGQRADLREQNMILVQRFLQGQARKNDQLLNSLTTTQIRKFIMKYNLFQSIWNKTKEEFNNQKLDLNGMRDLSVRNAVFLSEAYRQNNNWGRRQEILKTMRKLNFYT